MRTDAIAPLIAAALWGGMYVVSKRGFESIPPLALSFLRVALAAPVLLVDVSLTRPDRSFDRRDYRAFAVLGGWIAVTLAGQFVGTDRALGGVVLLLVASFGWAAYTVCGKPLVREYSALEAATYSTLASVPLLAVCVPLELAYLGLSPAEPPLTPAVVGAVSYLAIGSTAAAWYLCYRGLETLDAGRVAVFFFARPVAGAALGAIVLDESPGLPSPSAAGSWPSASTPSARNGSRFHRDRAEYAAYRALSRNDSVHRSPR